MIVIEDMNCIIVKIFDARSEEHTSEPSHITISYAVFCLKKKKRSSARDSCKHHPRSASADAKCSSSQRCCYDTRRPLNRTPGSFTAPSSLIPLRPTAECSP